ncbi:DUF1376 domain-containing protein [Mesorhizobium sp. WSM3876]|uniref:DUF1376 domain-containing protein n=1 Tax=Mesorhizobium sp. WSM3876 TaxID=422277 RepID=UPI000BAE9F9E|nr:DUF1376 domain-containing protein [Mesorhizobium sp. WSM3876]PBB85722.1 hypothetical protein CK216_16475 [Mesorhizobium sp. WSM3876]
MSTGTKPPPWFRFFAGDWIAKTRDLKAVEAGILIQLLAQMHQRGEPLADDDPSRLARLCGSDTRTFTRTLAMFLEDGRVTRTAGGLWSKLIQGEVDYRKNVSKVRSKNASHRWEKDKQNQQPTDANAYKSPEYRGQSIEDDAGAEGGSACGGPTAFPPYGRKPPLDSRDVVEVDEDMPKRWGGL